MRLRCGSFIRRSEIRSGWSASRCSRYRMSRALNIFTKTQTAKIKVGLLNSLTQSPTGGTLPHNSSFKHFSWPWIIGRRSENGEEEEKKNIKIPAATHADVIYPIAVSCGPPGLKPDNNRKIPLVLFFFVSFKMIIILPIIPLCPSHFHVVLQSCVSQTAIKWKFISFWPICWSRSQLNGPQHR